MLFGEEYIGNMKKKLLFVIPEYSHGGTNKSLENLLHFIDKSKYEVSIYSLYEDGGSLYKEIFAPYILKKSLLYTLAHDNKVTRKIMGLAMKLSSKVNFDWLYRYEVNRLQKEYKFDTVIAFQEGAATEFVSYIDKPVKKIAWIHFDYAMLKDKIDLRKTKMFYDKYQQIVCVSKVAMQSMLSVYPEYEDKSTFIYNTLSSSNIISQSKQKIKLPYGNSIFNILSIGRFVDVKQFHLIPQMAKDIQKRARRNFCWYIMGSGEMEEAIRRNILDNDLEDYVKIIEAQDNPYPYFAKADLHVCTSTFESFSYTIAESKILKTPVLSNDFPVAYEVVGDTVGWICNIEDMASKIADIINDKDGMYSAVKKSISSYDYDNEAILSKFYELIDDPNS